MSPPLVVAFAIAGRVDIDLSRDALGKGSNGKDVYLRDIWPNLLEIRPDIAQVNVLAVTAFAQRIPRQIDVHSSGDGECNHEWRTHQEVCFDALDRKSVV